MSFEQAYFGWPTLPPLQLSQRWAYLFADQRAQILSANTTFCTICHLKHCQLDRLNVLLEDLCLWLFLSEWGQFSVSHTVEEICPGKTAGLSGRASANSCAHTMTNQAEMKKPLFRFRAVTPVRLEEQPQIFFHMLYLLPQMSHVMYLW